MLKKLKKTFHIIKEMLKLKKVEISFKNYTEDSFKEYKEKYSYFTKPHRFKIIRNKTIGVALIELDLYENFDEYYKSINGKNSTAYYARKALRRGYKFVEIDRNNYIDDIYEINISSPVRQGRKMSESYLKRVTYYENKSNYRYFGVIDKEGKLRSYCNIGFFGEFVLVNTLLGHKKFLNDGIMYLMMVELNKLIFNEYKAKGYKYIMYDTFFGASEGLKKFKIKLGYIPYKVKWKWEK